MTGRRLGFWSSSALVVIGLCYAGALAAGFSRYGLHEPIADPLLAVMELLTLLSAPAIVALMAAVHGRAAPERRLHGVLALVFGALCAGTTSAVHFIELTAARQLGQSGLVWPSRTYAAELLAWDVFLGLALICAAETFNHDRQRVVRRALRMCGVLCLAGTIGPAVGNMRLQLIGVVGYGAVLPWVAVLLAREFFQADRDTSSDC